MPYATRKELPIGVKDHLPLGAQDIFKEAFNNAWAEYDHDEDRAQRVAWAAVKKHYHKDDCSGYWVEGDTKDA